MTKLVTGIEVIQDELRVVYSGMGYAKTIDTAKRIASMVQDYHKTLKITVQDAETRDDLMLAIKYLKEAKARFAINTTNSFVDDLIKKYSPEVEVWVDE